MRSRHSVNPRNFKKLTVLIGLILAAGKLGAYEIKEHKNVSSRKPVAISANQLLFNRFLSMTLFKGNVKAIHDQVTLTAKELRAFENNREATAEGHVIVIDPSSGMTLTCGNLEYQDLMDLMTAHDHPLLTAQDENGKPLTIQGRQIELDSENKTAVINQNVKIIHDDGEADAQKATYLSREDKFILEDDPKVITSTGDLQGRRITTNLGLNRSILVEGLAEATFYPHGKSVSDNISNSKGTSQVMGGGKSGSDSSGNVSIGGSSSATSSGSNPNTTPTPPPGNGIFPAGYQGPPRH